MIEPNREAPTSWGPVHISAHQPISRAVPSVAPLDAPHKTPAAAIDGRARANGERRRGRRGRKGRWRQRG
jgi:hypothetical protein